MSKNCHSRLWIYFTCVVFGVIAGVFLLFSIAWFSLYHLGFISVDPWNKHFPIVMLLLLSLLIGGAISLFVGKLMIRPIQNISDAFEELSKGNFDTKVPTEEKVLEIQDMAKKFNAMTYDLSHIETLRNDFVVSVSHEFKTPLAAINGYATLLQNPNLSKEQQRHYVDIILANTERLTNLSSDILSLSKLENRETVLHRTEFRLDEQIRKQILLLEKKWNKKNIEFDIELPKTIYYGNEGLLAQVWSNLLDNAIKASYQNGTIQISIQEFEKEISVTIADNGIGMPEEVQKHIFDKFYQADRSRKAEGNGLGLSLVKRIIELCDGSITVKSEAGQGAAFTILLPK